MGDGRTGHRWWRRVGPWVGIGTNPVALMTGGGVAEGNERWWLIGAVLLGVAALVTLAVGQGILGVRRRTRFAGVAATSLGTVGARAVASPVVAVMMIGWFGFNTALAGAGLGKLVGMPARAGVVVFALVMLAVAWWGLDTLSWTALAAGIATVALAAGGVRLALDHHSGPLLGDGVPAGQLGMLPAIAVIVGYGAAFSLRTPDFTHDLARPREVAWSGVVGLGLPLACFLVVGAILQLATGTWNLVDVLERIGSPTVAYAFLAIGFTGAVLSNLHSGAVAIEDMWPALPHRRGLLVTAATGTALALADYTDRMVPFLTVMALAAPCLIAVLWAGELQGRRAQTRFQPSGVAAWAVGGTVGAILAVTVRPLALPAGLAAAGLVALVASRRSRTS